MNKIKKKVKAGSKMGGPFQKMPNELLQKIFSSLSLKWVKVARLVCRRWFRVLNRDGLILNAILTDETITNVKYFTKPHLESLTVKKLSQDILRIYGPRTIPIPPTISKLILRNEIPFLYLAKLLQYYSSCSVNELVFTSFSLSTIRAQNIPKMMCSLKEWNYLKILKLWAARHYNNCLSRNEFAKHTQAIAKVLEIISLPTLEQLSLNLDAGLNGWNYKIESKYPLKDIYLQFATFLHCHQKLKALELKCFGVDYNSFVRTPSDLWKTLIVQLESIKLELREFNYNYMTKFLNTQKKVKHIQIESPRPFVIDKLLATNAQSLESITIFGMIGFYHKVHFEEFLNYHFTTSSTSTEKVLPYLVNFNLIHTHFLTESYQQHHYVDHYTELLELLGMDPEAPIKDVRKLLKWILKCFSNLQQVVFTIRGDSKHASKINNAANCILEKLKDLKTLPISQRSRLNMNPKNKNYNLNCNIMKGKKTSSGHCYERSVRICTTVSPSHK